ncbi:conserved membrane hypothetical protein [Capnocytophaga cynodegmi]|uniref:DUF4112 domain-containing protein n=2 Tax=Capnocytophaga cynodegmi TaxID=28189 RepID=A0A0B7HT35_9FLAO|nr:conserved membrane hypothetical protein [Capnocytophaga cynodegmi]CEN41067.1 conserved membrane hypothetical protein [Capnocytophaga cynodegmi]
MQENHRTRKKELKKLEIEKSTHYQIIKNTKKWMDDYHLDGLIGLIPIVGDIATQFFSYSFLYVAIVKVKSYRLTMAILLNSLIDILVGLIPYAGIVLDFVHRSYKHNFELIVGFVNDDKKVIQQVNRRALWTTIGVFVVLILIFVLIWLIITTFSGLYKWIFN